MLHGNIKGYLRNVPCGTKAIDVGAGAGFPSLPMKIYRPDLEFTLLDSGNKRITYLENGLASVAVSSGMAAITAAFLNITGF